MATQDGPPQSFSIHPDLLLSVLDDATALLDGRGRVRLTNPRMARLFTSDEGKRFLPFVEQEGGLWRLASAGAVGENLRHVVLGLEDVIAGARERLEMELDDAGASLLAIACAVDGGRGALVRARLRTAEEEHRARAVESVEAMQLGMNVYRMDDPSDERSFRVLYGNPASAVITGSPTSTLVGKRIDDLSPQPREVGLLAKFREVVMEGRSTSFEFTQPMRGRAEPRILSLKAFPLSGGCVGTVFEDVTERRALEESVRKTSQFLDSILDNIPMAIFIKEARGRTYVHVNRFLNEAFRGTSADWIGKTDYDILPKEVAERLVQQDLEVFAGRTIVDIPEELVPNANGQMRVCHTRKVPIYDANGEPLYLIGLSEDITERREAEDAKRRELVLLETQEKLVELVRQLSTPLLPLAEGVLVAPLVGQMDEARGAHFIEALLSGIQRWQAQTVLIDITGVPSMDQAVADQLLRATRAARLLGTETALVGVSPDVARTLVELGVDFTGLVTYADLRAGMRAAERKNRSKMGRT